MWKKAIAIFFLLVVGWEVDGHAHIFSACGFPSGISSPFFVQVVDITDPSSPSTVVANTSTGVVARQQQSKYCLYYSYSVTSGHDYEARFKDSTATPYEATDIANAYQTGGVAVTLATTQPNYAPAKAGDAMALTSGERTSTGTAVWATTTRALTDKTGFSLLASPPTAAQISTQVWTEALPGAFGAGTAGNKLNTASAAGDPWATTAGTYGAGSFGKIFYDNLNATITSRLAAASYAAPDNASISAIKTKTDNLPSTPASQGDVTSVYNIVNSGTYGNAAINTAMAKDSTVAKDATVAKAATVATEANLNSKIGTALTYTGGKPDVNISSTNDIDFSATQKASLNAATPSVTASVDQDLIAQTVWEYLLSSCNGVSGSVCAAMQSAASAGDPWAINIPGGYSAGTAGNVVGSILSGAVSTIQSRVNGLPTLADIEGSSTLLKKTTGSVTNQVGLTSDNKVNANASVTATVTLTQSDIDSIASAVTANVYELREGNVKKTFYTASSINTTRKVGTGRLDYVKIEIKADAASDWSAPVSTKYLYYWYARLGDVNPIKVGENN